MTQPNRMPIAGLKPKDLVGIPWRVAFALQAAGWYLRSDIIWSKPNPMPESVTDRPTKAHEYLFLLTKSERYFYNAEAIKEPARNDHSGNQRRDIPIVDDGCGIRDNHLGCGIPRSGSSRNKRTVWEIPTQSYPEAHFATFPEALVEPCILAGSKPGDMILDPFCGSGTTGAVAIRLQRNFLGVDLNANYLELARERIGNIAPLFGSETVA